MSARPDMVLFVMTEASTLFVVFAGAIYAMNSRVHTDGENVFAGNFATGTGGV